MSYWFRRFFFTLFSLWGAFSLSFALLHFIPGDPVDIMLGEQATTVDRAALRAQLGLDQPLLQQYLQSLIRVVQLDWGTSLLSSRPVAQEILERLPATIELTIAALFFALVIALPVGVFIAVQNKSLLARTSVLWLTLGMSVPSFWLAPVLIWIFAIQLDWLPVSERGTPAHLILPALSLAFGLTSVLIQITKSSVQDVLQEDYIRTAKAKGLGQLPIYFKHALRNAATPIITVFSLQLGAVLTGTVIIETVFDWPGIGTLLYRGIQERNYPLVQGCVLFISSVYIVTNLLADLAYAWVNPKVRLS